MNHQIWLWFWFLFGAIVYMGKRAFYLIKGPNPVASNLNQFFQVAGVPLVFRFIVDSFVFWACFTPQLLAAALDYFGWQSFSGVVKTVTQFAVCSAGFGLIVDTLMDFVIGTVISKIPLLKDWWPQMPAPLPPTIPPHVSTAGGIGATNQEEIGK
jgi:hypothetical protein